MQPTGPWRIAKQRFTREERRLVSTAIPRIVILLSNDRQRSVSSVTDAALVLAHPAWPRKNTAEYRDTARIVSEAVAGHCRSSVALAAFKRLAADAGVLSGISQAK
jgi:hypothetical protein